MNIKEMEILSCLPPALRDDIRRYFAAKHYSHADVINAERGNVWDMGKVNSLIQYLGSKNHSLKYISNAVNQSQDYCLLVLRQHRADDFKIKTTNWERLA